MHSIAHRLGSLLRVAGLASGLALAAQPGLAQETVTAQSLIDRQLILDQITRYYYNFGKAERQTEESFYAEDGVLILGTRRYEGHAGIKQAYGGARPATPPAGAAPAAPAAGAAPTAGAAPAPGAATAPAAPRERLPFNITVDNALIIVRGNTATSQVIFTEYRPEKKGDPMRMTTQGKEYATWTKVNGKWLYKTRQIASGSEPPAGWKE